MKRYTKTIEGTEVLFISIGDTVGWFFNLNGKEYGDYLTLSDKPKGIDDPQVVETFNILEQQAENILKELKQSKR